MGRGKGERRERGREQGGEGRGRGERERGREGERERGRGRAAQDAPLRIAALAAPSSSASRVRLQSYTVFGLKRCAMSSSIVLGSPPPLSSSLATEEARSKPTHNRRNPRFFLPLKGTQFCRNASRENWCPASKNVTPISRDQHVIQRVAATFAATFVLSCDSKVRAAAEDACSARGFSPFLSY